MSYYYGKGGGGIPYASRYRSPGYPGFGRGREPEPPPGLPGMRRTSPDYQFQGGGGGQPGYQGIGEYQMPPELQAMFQRFSGMSTGMGGGGSPVTPDWKPTGGHATAGGREWERYRVPNKETGFYDLQWAPKGGGGPGGGGGGYAEGGWGRGGETDITTDRYAYPEDVQNLMGRLGERGEEFLSLRPGYSDAIMKNMFGQEYDVLREAGQAQSQAALEGLQAGGQLGTGAQSDLAKEMAWGQQKNVGNLMRDIALREEEQKRADRYGYTQAAQGITGQLGEMRLGEEDRARMREALGLEAEMGRGQLDIGWAGQEQDMFRNMMAYQQMIENMNMMRRGEGRQGFQDFMQYFGMNQ